MLPAPDSRVKPLSMKNYLYTVNGDDSYKLR